MEHQGVIQTRRLEEKWVNFQPSVIVVNYSFYKLKYLLKKKVYITVSVVAAPDVLEEPELPASAIW